MVIAGSSAHTHVSVNHSKQCQDRILQLMKAQEGRDRLEGAERDARQSAIACRRLEKELEDERAKCSRVAHLAERNLERLADLSRRQPVRSGQAGAQTTKGRRTNN